MSCEKAFLKKPSFSSGKTYILKVRGVQVGSKNRLKIDQKMKSTWDGISASIFHRFWWIFGAKLGGKNEPKSINNGIEKTSKKRRLPKWPKRRSKGSQGVGAQRFLTPGEGYGGGVNFSPEGEEGLKADEVG